MPSESSEQFECAANTDREIWRKVPGDYYSPSLHVTAAGFIGIDVGGHVIILPVETWHDAAKQYSPINFGKIAEASAPAVEPRPNATQLSSAPAKGSQETKSIIGPPEGTSVPGGGTTLGCPCATGVSGIHQPGCPAAPVVPRPWQIGIASASNLADIDWLPKFFATEQEAEAHALDPANGLYRNVRVRNNATPAPAAQSGEPYRLGTTVAATINGEPGTAAFFTREAAEAYGLAPASVSLPREVVERLQEAHAKLDEGIEYANHRWYEWGERAKEAFRLITDAETRLRSVLTQIEAAQKGAK